MNGFNHFAQLKMLTGYAKSKGLPAPALAVGSSGVLLSWYDIAVIYAGFGENNKTLAALEMAHKNHSSHLNWVKVDPRFNHLHNYPRFETLLRQMNLQP